MYMSEVANTGDRAGDEVVQIYVKRDDDIDGPHKSLRAFERVSLLPGEKKQLSIDFPHNRFEGWDEDTHTMRVVPSTYRLMAGSSSADLKSTTVKIK